MPNSLSLAVTVESNSLELTTMLLDEDKWSEKVLVDVLSYAVGRNRVEIVKELLLQDGADPSRAPSYDNPPLVKAVEKGYNVVIDILLADPRTVHDISYSFKDRSILEKAAKKGYTNIVRSLLARGASAQPNVQTPMHSAVINGDPEMVKLFLNRDDVDHNTMFNGQTPLHHAVKAN